MIPRFPCALLACATFAVALAASASARAATSASAAPAAGVRTALALDCERLSGADMAALSTLPAPRIVNLQGSVPIVTMEPFAQFLIAMGYPEEALRDPQDGSLSESSYESSATLAGELAWYYERTGLRPMLIGHSQGGMLVVRTLHELAGAFSDAVAVVDPTTGAAEPRTTIVDPYTHAERPVVGLRVAFAAAIATGQLPRLLLGQWSMIPKLRKIPDSTLEFTGFAIAFDPIAGNLGTAEPYVATGRAAVRNVMLPATYSHIGAPITEHLAEQPATRAWIDAWQPDAAPPLPAAAADTRNLLHAADLWHSIRRHWCAEGQRRLRAAGGTS
ncbi:MAG TPA: hypothetical protein VF196_04845 [Casimicrobiaceae bacterium]